MAVGRGAVWEWRACATAYNTTPTHRHYSLRNFAVRTLLLRLLRRLLLKQWLPVGQRSRWIQYMAKKEMFCRAAWIYFIAFSLNILCCLQLVYILLPWVWIYSTAFSLNIFYCLQPEYAHLLLREKKNWERVVRRQGLRARHRRSKFTSNNIKPRGVTYGSDNSLKSTTTSGSVPGPTADFWVHTLLTVKPPRRESLTTQGKSYYC